MLKRLLSSLKPLAARKNFEDRDDAMITSVQPPVNQESEKSKLNEEECRLVELIINYEMSRDQHLVEQIIRLLAHKRDILGVSYWLSRLTKLDLFDRSFVHDVRSRFPIRFVAINVGPGFLYPLWHHISDKEEDRADYQMRFSDDMILPFPDSSIKIIYVRELFEIVAQSCLTKLLQECKRVLSSDGAIVLSSGAGSAAALFSLAVNNGLNVVSQDKKTILDRYSQVPRLPGHSDSSSLILAVI